MFKILDPCRKKTWAEMPGDERSRFCDVCGHQVHVLENYSRAEQQELLASSTKICAALRPNPLPKPSRRKLFTLSLLGMVRPLWAQTASVRIRVSIEPTAEALSGAQATAIERTNHQAVMKGISDSSGNVTLSGLPIGEKLRLVVDAQGYSRWSKDILLKPDEEMAITAALREAVIIGTVAVTSTVKRKSWWRRLFR